MGEMIFTCAVPLSAGLYSCSGSGDGLESIQSSRLFFMEKLVTNRLLRCMDYEG